MSRCLWQWQVANRRKEEKNKNKKKERWPHCLAFDARVGQCCHGFWWCQTCVTCCCHPVVHCPSHPCHSLCPLLIHCLPWSSPLFVILHVHYPWHLVFMHWHSLAFIHWCLFHWCSLVFIGMVVCCPGSIIVNTSISPYKHLLTGRVVVLWCGVSHDMLLFRNGTLCHPVSRGSQQWHRAWVWCRRCCRETNRN